jgi:uncharacterized DUF497 family protein
VNGLILEWSRDKAESNWKKHRVTFSEAATAFGDPLSRTIPDPDHSFEEDRFVTLGKSRSHVLLVVIHTERAERIRIIGARRATRSERGDYENRS